MMKFILKKIKNEFNADEEWVIRNVANTLDNKFCLDLSLIFIFTIIFGAVIHFTSNYTEKIPLLIWSESFLAVGITLLGVVTWIRKICWMNYLYSAISFIYITILMYISSYFAIQNILGFNWTIIFIFICAYSLSFFVWIEITVRNLKFNETRGSRNKRKLSLIIIPFFVIAFLVGFLIQRLSSVDRQSITIVVGFFVPLLGTVSYYGVFRALCIKKYFPNEKWIKS